MAHSIRPAWRLYGVSKIVILLLIMFDVSKVACQSDKVNSSSELDDSIPSDYRLTSKIAWVSEVFDHHRWNAARLENVAAPCVDQLRSYLRELRKGTLWASKISDASGRYMGNVLFGNDYWLGSMNACTELGMSQYNQVVPPFAVNFFVAKFNMSLSDGHLPLPRLMFMGLCLPGACKPPDVAAILTSTTKMANGQEKARGRVNAKISVLTVRQVPGAYTFWGDYKFYIIGTSGLLTVILVIVASLYEAVLEHKKAKETDALDQNEEKSLEMSLNNNSEDPRLTDVVNGDPKNGKNHHNGSVKIENGCASRDKPELGSGTLSQILLSFSALSNGRKIMSVDETSGDTLTCLHGIRFLSVFWVIMVHTYLAVFYVADNKTLRVVTERNFGYQTVGNASYTVDSFFFISGLLVTILYFRSYELKQAKLQKAATSSSDDKPKNGYTNHGMSTTSLTTNGSQNETAQNMGLAEDKGPLITVKEFTANFREFGVMVLYRYLRLTPVYAFVIGLNELNVRLHINESVFEPGVTDDYNCGNYWWRNVLYINNWFPLTDMCMIWSWYMAADTQFYVIGIIILLISARFFKFSAISVIVIMISSWLTSLLISLSYQYKARIQEPFEMFDPLYDKPWSRIGAYLVGMITGWYLHHTKCKVRIPVWVQIICWPASLLIMGSLIYGMVDGYLEVWWTAFYVSVGHTAWAVALSWVTIACCTGHGGLVNSILSYRGALPLSRLTYCAYLVHPLILMMSTYQMDGPLHLQNGMVLIIYAGNTVMSFLMSFALSMCFEAPVVRLMKVIMGRKPSRSTRTRSHSVSHQE